MICYLYPAPTYLLFSNDVPALLYYAQIPATVIALFLGFYIFWNAKHLLLNRLLFLIAILFSLWTLTTLIVWAGNDGGLMVFIWPFYNLILSFIAVFCVYFIYVFLEKKDVTFSLKTIFLILLAPVLILATTKLNISGFDITNCDAFEFEWLPLKIYSSLLGALAMIWIFILLIRQYQISAQSLRKQIILMGIGIEFFLFSFFGMEFIATYLTRIGLFADSQLELYGLFGMVIFMIYISILIVRFGTFSVKLIATQALIWGLVALIGSQFFFIKETTNYVLNSIGFVAAIVLGQYLIKSVKKEIEQKEQLATLLKQRESLVHLITHKVKGSFTRMKAIFSGMLDGSFGNAPEEIKKMANKGLEFDNNGIQTVDLVLNTANLQNGLIKYDMQKINFKDILLKAAEEKKIQAKNKKLEIETKINDGKYEIMGDTFWLSEMLNNLIDNSIRYTEEGKIVVGLEKDDKKLLFSVKDTGVGITEEDKKRLFTEGGRGKNSVLVNVDSTGYGLFTVKLIVDAHKGKVWAESAGEGKGSQFYVELPIA